jgi:hypothetical protein
MPRRVAFLIGNQTFRADSGLLPLEGPANDLKAFGRLLSDPEHGGFEVTEFLDKPGHEVLPEIEQALSAAAPSDLFLIYYSGHGKLDRNGRLCLAMANTRQNALFATSIPTRHLGDIVEHSDCDQVVLLLDCCYSGAVGVRGDVVSELRVVENARGFYIMTASSEMQAAREEEPATGGAVMGRFTAALVNGIESGAADQEYKGKVLLSDLRRYLERVVTGQTPKFFARSASGDPLISKSPATATPLLDLDVLADLDALQWHRQRGAVLALVGVLLDGDAAARSAAKAALLGKLGRERDYEVRLEVGQALGRGNIDDLVAPSKVPTKPSAGSASYDGSTETPPPPVEAIGAALPVTPSWWQGIRNWGARSSVTAPPSEPEPFMENTPASSVPVPSVQSSSKEDPSMEDILASIRRILNEDEDPSPTPEASSTTPPAPSVPVPSLQTSSKGEPSMEDILASIRRILNEDEEPPSTPEASSTMSPSCPAPPAQTGLNGRTTPGS